MGSFEQWRNVIGGILKNADIDGFLENNEKMYKLADTDGPQWNMFVEAWYEHFKEKSVTSREVYNGAKMYSSLLDALPDQFIDLMDKEGKFTRSLGIALAKNKDRRYPSGLK